MNRSQNTSGTSASGGGRTQYRGPFTLGLDRLSRSHTRTSISSRPKALACFASAAGIGLVAAHGLLNGPVPSTSAMTVAMAGGATASAAGASLLGGLGLVLSVGFSLAGAWFWPFKHRTKAQRRDESMAAYDHITGLPTLRLFTVLLDQALTRASHMGRSIGVLVAELQQFHPQPTAVAPSNMSLIVRVQAARIKSALPPNNTVARIGERRFAVLIEEVVARDQIDAPAQNIYRTMSLPLMIEGQEVLLTCQIGGAMYSAAVSSGEALLSQAVKALACATTENPIRFTDAIGEIPPGSSTPVSAPAIESSLPR